jgi:PadR family transcriptional regulator PadR
VYFLNVTPTHDPQLLKGVLSLLLLQMLAQRESYGYELVQRLHEIGLSDISDGTVYPALGRLERESRVSARLVSSHSGPARKYYRPTAAGYAALAEGVTGWLAFVEVTNPVLLHPIPTQPGPPTEEVFDD